MLPRKIDRKGEHGRPSNHKLPQAIKNEALKIITVNYPDFGPTFATEKLRKKHNLVLSVETVRALMITNHLWVPHAAGPPIVHKLRPRRLCFGELIQIDGSEHHWFEDRGPSCTLIVMIDDATSFVVGLLFATSESLETYFQAVRPYFIESGLPLAMYSDRLSVFEVARKTPLPEEQAPTQFERAMKELDIELIRARSPEAKGRVERVNRTFQDRLVKELRLASISDINSANAFLREEGYLTEHNAMFAIPPAQRGNVHRPLNQRQLQQLDRILSPNYKRVVQKDLSFQYNHETYQINLKGSLHEVRGKKIVLWKDKMQKIHAQFMNQELEIRSMKEIEYSPQMPTTDELAKRWRSKTKYKPNIQHPYKTKFKLKRAI